MKIRKCWKAAKLKNKNRILKSGWIGKLFTTYPDFFDEEFSNLKHEQNDILSQLSTIADSVREIYRHFCEGGSRSRKEHVKMCYDNKMTGQIIGMLRVQRGMSQEVLSGLAGIARGHLGMIETGAKNANVETLWRISRALGIRLSDLIRMVEDQTEENA